MSDWDPLPTFIHRLSDVFPLHPVSNPSIAATYPLRADVRPTNRK